jgi:hypothetical protein
MPNSRWASSTVLRHTSTAVPTQRTKGSYLWVGWIQPQWHLCCRAVIPLMLRTLMYCNKLHDKLHDKIHDTCQW